MKQYRRGAYPKLWAVVTEEAANADAELVDSGVADPDGGTPMQATIRDSSNVTVQALAAMTKLSTGIYHYESYLIPLTAKTGIYDWEAFADDSGGDSVGHGSFEVLEEIVQ